MLFSLTFCSISLAHMKIVTADWYTTTCLQIMLPKELYYDNAPVHSAQLTMELLSSDGIKLMSHPICNYLVLCDFFLYSTMEMKLREIHFSTKEKAVNAFEEHVT